MRTQTTGTATMTATAADAVAAGVTCEEYARGRERRYVANRGGSVRSDVAFGVYVAAARSWERAAGVVTAAERYAAGLARLDAAVKAGCEMCGGAVYQVRPGLIECEDPACYWCKSTEAH